MEFCESIWISYLLECSFLVILINHYFFLLQYASILMGISNTFATIPGIVSPGLTGVIVSDQVNKPNKPNVNDNELFNEIHTYFQF